MEKKQSQMSKPSYQALLQSLDENDVSRGLGRSIKIRKRTGGCCRCCGPSVMWTCIVLLILIGLVLSIGIPLMLSSSLPWRQWLHLNFTDWTSSSVATPLNHSVSTASDQTDKQTTARVPLAEDQTMSELNSTINSETPQVTQPSFVQRANEWIHQFIQLTRETFDELPKVPLIIGLSLVVLVIFTVLWMILYRRLLRRQRRRTLGKLVTDLQSGDKSILLNSDDSDED